MSRWSLKELFTNLRRKLGIDRLERREKWFLGGGIGFVGCFILVQLVVVPFFEAKNTLEKAILRKESDVLMIAQLSEEYFALKQEEGGIQIGIDRRSEGFSLFTYLDQQAELSQVKKQISSMKPSLIEGDGLLNEAVVEVNMQRVNLQSLVDFLLLVESSENVVFVRRISIQESGRKQGLLDAIMQIVTFEKKG